MRHFDQIIVRVMEHGLFNKWETEVYYIHLFLYFLNIFKYYGWYALQIVDQYLNLSTENYLRQMATGYSANAGPVVLRVAHIQGPLVMLFVGVAVASLILVGEIICFKYQMKKRRSRL